MISYIIVSKENLSMSSNITQSINSENDINQLVDANFIASLFNLNSTNIQFIHCINDPQTSSINVHITLVPTYPACPCCGASPHIKDYRIKKINHSALTHLKLTILYNERRYKCPVCKKTFRPFDPFQDEYLRQSSLTSINILNSLKESCMTMTQVARQNNVSPTTVANTFDLFVDIPRKTLPKFLCVDEVYAFKSNNSKYVCVLLDYKNRVPVEILPSRHYTELSKFFSNIPKEERDQVHVFSSDMWESYQSIAKVYLPNAIRIIDRFHVQAECNKRLDHVRLSIQNGLNRKSDEYYLIKHFSWLLYSNDDELLDPNRKKKYNKKLKQYLNYYDIKCLLQKTHPNLEVAINLKDALTLYYDGIKIVEAGPINQKEDIPELKKKYDGSYSKKNLKIINEIKKRNLKRSLTEEDALLELEELIKAFRECEIVEMSNFASTLNKWKKEIVNSLRIYSELNHRTVSNAIIENRNKIIKNVKHNSNGYHNWKRFRNRLMYVLNPNASHRIIPDPLVVESKRILNKKNYESWKERHHG